MSNTVFSLYLHHLKKSFYKLKKVKNCYPRFTNKDPSGPRAQVTCQHCRINKCLCQDLDPKFSDSKAYAFSCKTSLSLRARPLMCVTWRLLQNMQRRCKCWSCQVSRYPLFVGVRVQAFAPFKSGEQSLTGTRGNSLGGLWLLWRTKLCLC